MSLKTPMCAVAAAVALLVAQGCATVKYTSPGAMDGIDLDGANGRPSSQQVFIKVSGYHMFWTIPLFCGDIRWNPKTESINGGVAFFKDLVGLEEVQDVLIGIAESRNCDAVDISFTDSDTSYAGPSTEGVIGLLFGSSRISASAVLVPRTADGK